MIVNQLKTLNETDFKYAPFFCEENIWHLGNDLVTQGFPCSAISVLFFFLPEGFVPLFNQKLCEMPNPVVWDYHVVLKFEYSKSDTYIIDFDSKIQFVTPIDQYLEYTFPLTASLASQFQFLIRSVPLSAYLQHFHSDRSHMLSETGEPQHPFPNWPCILTENDRRRFTLKEYISLTEELAETSTVKSHTQLLSENNVLF
jgi:hypothetical protein